MENIETGDLIISDGTCAGILHIATVTEVREKAVKIDWGWESSKNRSVTVFTYTMWVPKSVIILCPETPFRSLKIKKWFINSMQKDKVFKTKPYFLQDGRKVFI
jgi:hypothetical protein